VDGVDVTQGQTQMIEGVRRGRRGGEGGRDNCYLGIEL